MVTNCLGNVVVCNFLRRCIYCDPTTLENDKVHITFNICSLSFKTVYSSGTPVEYAYLVACVECLLLNVFSTELQTEHSAVNLKKKNCYVMHRNKTLLHLFTNLYYCFITNLHTSSIQPGHFETTWSALMFLWIVVLKYMLQCIWHNGQDKTVIHQ